MKRGDVAVNNEDELTIACIGLGVMGRAMAGRLLAAGFRVHGVDPDPQSADHLRQQGGQLFPNPKTASAGCQAALIMVSNDSQVQTVLFGPEGIAHSMSPGSVVWVASTIPPEVIQACAQRLGERGLMAVDGPVSGGRTKAEEGRLTIIAGGSAAAVGLARPYMLACASEIHHVGDVGVASTIKIINNLLAASHVALTAEALSFGAKAGVPLDKLIQVISSSSGASQMFLNRARRMVSGDHDVHASVSTFLKDLNIAMDSADDLGSPVPVSRAAREVFMAASAAGLEGSSDTKLFDFYGAAMQLRHGQ